MAVLSSDEVDTMLPIFILSLSFNLIVYLY
jgi:hypothetical protein